MKTKVAEDLLLASGKTAISTFETAIKDVPYERKGVLFSEMFFLYALTAVIKPRRIIESGRARGQSTHVLALCFPDTPISSIEFDRSSPDVAVAEARLRGFGQLKLLYGDSVAMAPGLVSEGDVVLIDGPKGARGLRLALTLLRERKPAAVFVHDTPVGSDERQFLARHVPSAFYSDHPRFVKAYSYLDRGHTGEVDSMIDAYDRLSGTNGRAERRYGYTFACIPYEDGFPYAATRAWLNGVFLVRRIMRSIGKRIGVNSREEPVLPE